MTEHSPKKLDTTFLASRIYLSNSTQGYQFHLLKYQHLQRCYHCLIWAFKTFLWHLSWLFLWGVGEGTENAVPKKLGKTALSSGVW